MILEGFEIENWSCIKKVSITGLPPTGVIVLHGPNRTGKSSIVQALRACLMDYPSTTTALKSYYPRGSAEKPAVSVTFHGDGRTYRITKHFGSTKSTFAIKTPEGAWKIEPMSCAEIHQRACGFAGGDDSAKGLHQLLWLTQAEFQLPDPRRFDTTVQAQLRGILGVLQTPLDDRFIERVKKRWNKWHSGQRRPDKEPSIKEGCAYAGNLKELEAGQQELGKSEAKFKEVEGLIQQTEKLELTQLDLKRQLRDASCAVQALREEYQRSQWRISERQQAEKDHSRAKDEYAAALHECRQRSAAVGRWNTDKKAIEPAEMKVREEQQYVERLKKQLQNVRDNLKKYRDQRRDLQECANRVTAKLGALALMEKLDAVTHELERANEITNDISEIERYLANNPAPDAQTLESLKRNRYQAARLQADREAASLNVTIILDAGASPAQLTIDGGTPLEISLPNSPLVSAVKRKANLRIGGWGEVELSRGTASADFDQLEENLRKCDQDFANGVAPFGINASDPQALDLLLGRVSEHQLRTASLAEKKKELKRIARQGVGPLQAQVVELQTKVANPTESKASECGVLPPDQSELEKLAAGLVQQMSSLDISIHDLEDNDRAVDGELITKQQDETTAKEILAACKAKANRSREEVERLRTAEQVKQRIEDAFEALRQAQARLKVTELTRDESTVTVRVEAAEQAVQALEKEMGENERKYERIKGRLEESEGLHARRAALAARVDELTRITEREKRERDAVDRLYALFEECREKQLGALMAPIQDRVLGWMRLLAIGDYKEVRFNDSFLPDKLLTSDGASEFAINEESTGAQELIGMLIRLGLGSILASADKPAVAIMDDPLTHSDVGRLNRMRVILRRVAEGDPKLTPPAGPLQIFIFTCHPERFRDERATVIDLEEVMSRWPV
jgi:DNA repair exonuclease SbcCD ATPase subunit